MIPNKISARQHGYADWGFVAGLFLIPRLVKVNSRAQKFYDGMACNIVAVNGTTNHGVGFMPLLSVKTHEKLDYANLALLYGMFAAKIINQDRAARGFHTGLTALATANVLLTEYKNVNDK